MNTCVCFFFFLRDDRYFSFLSSVLLFLFYLCSYLWSPPSDVFYMCSHSGTIKVPVSWEALVKLVNWFYSNELSRPPSGCLWDYMETKEKLYELKPYVELCWLAEFWFLEDLKEPCSNVIVFCLDSSRLLSINVIQIAANLSLWKMAEVAANYMAPLYRQLRDSGELEVLDDMLVDMVRAASVRLSQEGGSNSW
jgi:hypothetical protein